MYIFNLGKLFTQSIKEYLFSSLRFKKAISDVGFQHKSTPFTCSVSSKPALLSIQLAYLNLNIFTWIGAHHISNLYVEAVYKLNYCSFPNSGLSFSMKDGFLKNTQSQKCRTAEKFPPLEIIQSNPWSEQGQLEPRTCPVECLQEWRLHNHSGQHAPVFLCRLFALPGN